MKRLLIALLLSALAVSGHAATTTAAATPFSGGGCTAGAACTGTTITSTAGFVSTLGTITADAQNWSGTATWNNSGVTFTGLKLNITDTASAAGSLLMDLRVGSTSKLSVAKNGMISFDVVHNAANTTAIQWYYAGYGLTSNNNGETVVRTNAVNNFLLGGDSRAGSGGTLGFSSNADPTVAVSDSAFSRISAGIIGVGTGAAASTTGGLQAATLQTNIAAGTLTLTAGAIGMQKMTASGTAPGAAGGKIELVCGTNAGTAKLVAAAGTSGTAVTIVDNVGSGVTGC